MKKQKGEMVRKISMVIITLLIIAVLGFLVTWQPKEQTKPYTPYEVSTQTIEKTLEENGLVTKRMKDDKEQTVVQLFVDEYDIGKLSVDQEVTLNIEALDEKGEELAGTIDTIADDPRITGDVSEYEVIVEFTDDLPEGIKIGMHVDMSVQLDAREDVLAVPNDSLYEEDGDYYVDLLHEQRRVYFPKLGLDREIQTTERVKVTIGFEGDQYTEITDGVNEGDTIVAE